MSKFIVVFFLIKIDLKNFGTRLREYYFNEKVTQGFNDTFIFALTEHTA